MARGIGMRGGRRRRDRLGLAAVVCLAASPCLAAWPDTLFVREVLVAEGSDWYRSASSVDPVEAALARGDWSPPAPDATWRRAVADSADWIPMEERSWAYARIECDVERTVLLEGFGYRTVIVNGEHRTGNVYGYQDVYQDWEPHFDYSRIPIRLRPGNNDFLFHGSRAGVCKARLVAAPGDVWLNAKDATLPDLVAGVGGDALWGALVVVNASLEWRNDLVLDARVASGDGTRTRVPAMPPLSVRKAAFPFRAPALGEGTAALSVVLLSGAGGGADAKADSATFSLPVRPPAANRRVTFRSGVDGSVQFYGFLPATRSDAAGLVLTLHGAGVDAFNQSGSYRAKSWTHIVAPTNRRPYGYNWEDWGRLDALEALDHAAARLRVDPARTYLTGHSMGGHGTWHLGALHPGRFAALGPSAGWLSFWSYRPQRAVEPRDAVERMLERATLPSRTLDLVRNYADAGVYILHGVDDDNVPIAQARTMVEELEPFHRDFLVHEQPGAGHWWDLNDEPGADCVDWPPMFDFFARRARPGAAEIRTIRFLTPNPGVSSTYAWATIERQTHPLLLSSVDLRVDPVLRRFSGSTENVARLTLDLSVLEGEGPVQVDIDGTSRALRAQGKSITLVRGKRMWEAARATSATEKGPHRAGTFKDAFKNRVVFVVGTAGEPAENAWSLAKARFDAEQFWYDGNGSVDVVLDREFDPNVEPDRNVVLYGNASTNRAWNALLGKSPLQVKRGKISLGRQTWSGVNLGALFLRPRPGSDVASVAAVAGTGTIGMRLLDARPYLSPGFAYPDLTLFRAPAPDGETDRAAFLAGFFANDWSLDGAEIETNSN